MDDELYVDEANKLFKCCIIRVFIKHQRSENSPLNLLCRILRLTFGSFMAIFYSDVEPHSNYSLVTLDLSPATRILNENPE